MVRPVPALRLVAGTALAAACVPLARAAVRAPGVIGRGHALLWDVAAWAVLAGLAAFCLRKAPKRAAVGVALAVGLALRVASLATAPPLSDDLYRYGWDGRVQSAGIDPYRYAPDAPQLAGLRDKAWLWPTPGSVHGCHVIAAARHGDHTCTLINRSGVHTIYPPAAELWYTALHAVGLEHLQAKGYEGAGLLCDLAILAMLLALLRRHGRDERLIAVWALSPLPVLEYVADGHVDGLALVVTLGALALARRRPTLAAALLAVATLVKLYPALLIVAILPRRFREAVRPAVTFVAVCAAGYLPHVLAVGSKVLGYLPGYLKEEDYTSGTRYLLLDDLGLRGEAATLAVAVVLAAAVGLVVWRRPGPFVAATWLYGTLLLLTTPVQPWYAAALGGVALACGRWEWLAVGLAGYPLYVHTLLRAHDAVTVGRVSYGLAFAVVVAGSLIRHGGVRPRMPGCPDRTESLPHSPTRYERVATTP